MLELRGSWLMLGRSMFLSGEGVFFRERGVTLAKIRVCKKNTILHTFFCIVNLSKVRRDIILHTLACI